ncbi:MAG TPA: chaperone NapD [Magnetospirillum sp.]|jgi:nitrate reductase NapD|nr:chaperone NapD [Magnetospirillum sp.]
MRVNGFVARERERAHPQLENVCGVLVHVRPERRHDIAKRLEELPGVEIHAIGDDGKLIVTVEDAGGTWAGATIDQFNTVQGVLSVALVYHHFDSELEGEIVP